MSSGSGNSVRQLRLWLLPSGNLATQIWFLQFGFSSLDSPIWILQFGFSNLDPPTICFLQFGFASQEEECKGLFEGLQTELEEVTEALAEVIARWQLTFILSFAPCFFLIVSFSLFLFPCSLLLARPLLSCHHRPGARTLSLYLALMMLTGPT